MTQIESVMSSSGVSPSAPIMQLNQSARSRILQEQRQAALQRRQNQLKRPELMRTTNHPGSPPLAFSNNHYNPQHTPAIRQFSAPKQTKPPKIGIVNTPEVFAPTYDNPVNEIKQMGGFKKSVAVISTTSDEQQKNVKKESIKNDDGLENKQPIIKPQPKIAFSDPSNIDEINKSKHRSFEEVKRSYSDLSNSDASTKRSVTQDNSSDSEHDENMDDEKSNRNEITTEKKKSSFKRSDTYSLTSDDDDNTNSISSMTDDMEGSLSEKEKEKKSRSNIRRSLSTHSDRHSATSDDDDDTIEITSEEDSQKKHMKSKTSMVQISDSMFSIQTLGLDDFENMRKFLMSPLPRNAGTIHCYIRRNRRKTKLYPEYSVFLKDGDSFLMSSRKRPNNKTSNYLISMVQNDYDRNSKNILGKLRANFVGTEFQLYDAGRSPKEFIDPFMTDMDKSKEMRSELGVILYARNVLGSKGPRKMQICLNKVNEEDDSASVWQPSHKDEDMLTVFKHRRQPAVKKLFMLQNKKPMWNDSVGAFVLNFNGRVTMASVKNFQLTEEGYDDSIILQFGRTQKDEFTMDFRWPMTPFQAFGITLSSFDSKIACD